MANTEYTIEVLGDGLTIIEYVCDKGRPVTLAEMVKELNMTKNKLFRILWTLEQKRYVIKEGISYVPGPKNGENWLGFRRWRHRFIDMQKKRIEKATAELEATAI